MIVKRKYLIVILCVVMLFPSSAFALTSGFDGINKYSSLLYPDCDYGDRAGASYVNNLKNALPFTNNFIYTDNLAWEWDLTSYQYMNGVDFFAFSGHGFNESTESTAHFYVKNNGDPWHSSSEENYDSVNASTNEVRFGHDKLKWVTMYSCNWLTNNGSTTKLENIYKTFEGATLTMGFASVIYLDSREGTEYGNNISSGMSFRSAFIEAAKIYQVQRETGDSIARVQGYTLAKDDTKNGYFASLPETSWYINYPSAYSIIQTVTIPHTGQKI